MDSGFRELIHYQFGKYLEHAVQYALGIYTKQLAKTNYSRQDPILG